MLQLPGHPTNKEKLMREAWGFQPVLKESSRRVYRSIDLCPKELLLWD